MLDFFVIHCHQFNSIQLVLYNQTFLQFDINLVIYTNSYVEVFLKVGILENFAKSTGKHLCQSHFLIKLPCMVYTIQTYTYIHTYTIKL